MTEPGKPEGHLIARDKLDPDFPTNTHPSEFWSELGRTVAMFGFIEEMLGKAIYALTGTKEFDPEKDPDAFDKWIKTLERALTDQLGGLIFAYEKALADNDLTKDHDFSALIAQLKDAKDIRNALCHGSWDRPDADGRSLPKFVNKKLMVFETRVDVEFFKQTRKALRDMICDILDSVTALGYQFPGSESPGQKIDLKKI